MGRAFEFRKERKFKRWAAMSKTFTRIGKEIAMSVKAGGPDPDSNARLRAIIQNAKTANMPKATVDAAIKRATDKDASNFDEVAYEGYGPFGVAILIETATDNTTRTVANIRSFFNKFSGTLGTQGSLDFVFERQGHFTIKNTGKINVEELEFELIDSGLAEIEADDEEIFISTKFVDFGSMQKKLEEKGFEILSAEKVREALSHKEVTEEQRETINKLVEKFEEDDDVQQVFTNMS